MKRERWGSLLVQEKYQEEMPVTRDIHNNNNNNIVLGNQEIHTDRELANRPDIMIKTKKEKRCTLLDVAKPAGGNIT